MTRVVAYSRSGELAYAIPFTASGGSMPMVEDWLRPGEPMPSEFTRLIGSGATAGRRWSVTLHAGPWGNCVVLAIQGDSATADCWSGSTHQTGLIISAGGAADLPWWVIGGARPTVSYLVLSMADGSTRHVPTVQVGKLRLYAIVIIHGPRIARWAAYDASGRRLYGGHGSPVSR